MINKDDLDDPIIILKVTCQFCGEEFESEIDPMDSRTYHEQLADDLNQNGWDNIESEKFQIIGIGCADCVETPDEEREI